MADQKISGLPTDSALAAGDYFPINDSSGPTTKRTLLSTLAAWLFNQANLPSGATGSPVTRGAENMFNYVASGMVWSGNSYGSTRNASMTAGVAYINGRRISVAAVVARAFTASVDTYVDLLDNLDGTGTLVYTTVANNAASPALAANSMRIAIIVAGASSIASAAAINQGQTDRVLPISSNPYTVTDSLGNLIFNTSPNPTIIGYRQITSGFTTSSLSAAQISGLSVPVIVPAGRKIEVEAFSRHLVASTGPKIVTLSIWDGGVGTGTQISDHYSLTTGVAGANAAGGMTKGYPPAPSVTTSKTYNGGLTADTSASATAAATATSPAYLAIKLV